MTSRAELSDLERAAAVSALVRSARAAATELVLAHHLTGLLGADTGWFLETAVLVVDLAHDIDPIQTKETNP